MCCRGAITAACEGCRPWALLSFNSPCPVRRQCGARLQFAASPITISRGHSVCTPLRAVPAPSPRVFGWPWPVQRCFGVPGLLVRFHCGAGSSGIRPALGARPATRGHLEVRVPALGCQCRGSRRILNRPTWGWETAAPLRSGRSAPSQPCGAPAELAHAGGRESGPTALAQVQLCRPACLPHQTLSSPYPLPVDCCLQRQRQAAVWLAWQRRRRHQQPRRRRRQQCCQGGRISTMASSATPIACPAASVSCAWRMYWQCCHMHTCTAGRAPASRH